MFDILNRGARWFELAAVLLAPAGALGAAGAAELPRAERLATPPVRTLVGYTRRVLHLQDGHTLAVFSYSGSAAANWLFLIDARDLSSKRFAIPNNDIASHSAALGSDGNIYIMPYQTPRAYRFDVARERFSELSVAGSPPGEFTWDAIGGADGGIYYGTYPHACVGRYDVATGQGTVWVQPVANTTYVSSLARNEAGGGAFALAWGPDRVWLKLDKAHAPERSGAPPADPAVPPPPAPPGEESLGKVVRTGDTTFGVGFPSSKLYELGREAKVRGDAGAPAEPWMLEAAGDAIVGISHYGALFRYDRKSGRFTRGQLDNLAPGGNAIMFLEAITPDCVLGGNYSQQNLFCVSPATGEVKSSPHLIARTSGETTCAVALAGKAYLGIYIHALVSVYDPQQPFTFGKNPLELGELWQPHKQTRPIGAATDGKLIFVTTESDYGQPPGGALAVFDPATRKFEAYPNLVAGLNLETLAYDAGSRLLWVGTDRWGQMHSAPPTQPSAGVFAFDPATRKVAALLRPFASADVVNVLGCPREGLVVATDGAQMVTLDTQARTCSPLRFPTPPPRAIRRGADGDAYFCAADCLYRWRVGENTFTPLAACPGCTRLAEASPGVWLLADSTSVYRVRLAKRQ